MLENMVRFAIGGVAAKKDDREESLSPVADHSGFYLKNQLPSVA
jgi:hypothetical protein